MSYRETKCLCNSDNDLWVGSKIGYPILECRNCGLIRTGKVKENYKRLYTEGNTYHKDRDGHIPYRERFWHDYAVGLQRVGKLYTYIDDLKFAYESLLDVGCANGGFVLAADMNFFRASGLEINEGIAEWARIRTGRPIYTDWGEIINKKYDVITYHDVLEHIPDPITELNKVKDYLEDQGVLVIDVPDIGHEDFELFGMEWHHIKPEEHLWFFDESTLGALLEDQGFDIIKIDRPIPGKLVIYSRIR